MYHCSSVTRPSRRCCVVAVHMTQVGDAAPGVALSLATARCLLSTLLAQANERLVQRKAAFGGLRAAAQTRRTGTGFADPAEFATKIVAPIMPAVCAQFESAMRFLAEVRSYCVLWCGRARVGVRKGYRR